jgi:hypothetical protein
MGRALRRDARYTLDDNVLLPLHIPKLLLLTQ